MYADIRCPECGGNQVEICTPPMITGIDSEGGYYEIEPQSSWVCMNEACRADGPDADADLIFIEVSDAQEVAA